MQSNKKNTRVAPHTWYQIRYAGCLNEQIQKALDELPGEEVFVVQVEDLITCTVIVWRTIHWYSGRRCKQILLLFLGLKGAPGGMDILGELLQDRHPLGQILCRTLSVSSKV